MTQHTLLKSSSRAGRFKKKLVSEDKLNHEAPLIVARMAPLLKMLQENLISEAEFTALNIICTLSLRYPGTWLGAKSLLPLQSQMTFLLKNLPWSFEKNIEARLTGVNTLGELLSGFAFQSTPQSVNRSLLHWSTGHYPLILFFTIPTPEEVLAQQTQGRRCVTVMMKEAQLKRYVLGERDSLSFTMHDLIHADHFYFHNDLREGQIAFYNFLNYCFQQRYFSEQLKKEKFAAEFDYLISDMNAYPVHLMKCLKSALIHYHEDGQSFFTQWVKSLDLEAGTEAALLNLNSPNYHPESMDAILLEFFAKFKV